MQARRPEELPLVFRDRLNAGDLAGLMADYYASDAAYAPVPGVVVTGSEVEAAIGRLVALGTPIEVTVRHVLEAGDTALLVVDWEIPEAGMSGTATDVARRQPDGTWRCVIDNPHGGARTVDLRPAVAAVLAGDRQGP
jgi:ketosteroid isomerase-like protein